MTPPPPRPETARGLPRLRRAWRDEVAYQQRLRAERRRGALSAPVAFEELARSCRLLARARSDLLRDTLQSFRDLL